MANYNYGASVRLQATFKDAAEVLTNPTVVTLRVYDSSGVVTTYTGAQLTNPSTGVYHRDVTVNMAGPWHFWFVGAGGVTAEGGGEMSVTAGA